MVAIQQSEGDQNFPIHRFHSHRLGYEVQPEAVAQFRANQTEI